MKTANASAEQHPILFYDYISDAGQKCFFPHPIIKNKPIINVQTEKTLS